jgi:hypothetical protein
MIWPPEHFRRSGRVEAARPTRPAPRDPESGEGSDAMIEACLTVSQVQSIPWAAAPSSASLLLVTSVFVTSIVMGGNAAKPCTNWAAAAVGAPVSLREKETGAGWRTGMVKRIGCCRAAMKGMSCRSGHTGKSRHPSHRCDRASRRTLIALWENRHGMA